MFSFILNSLKSEHLLKKIIYHCFFVMPLHAKQDISFDFSKMISNVGNYSESINI